MSFIKNRHGKKCDTCKSSIEIVGDNDFDCGICAGRVVINDGLRSDAGYKGVAGDCVTRAIVIASGMDYQQVYDDLSVSNKAAYATWEKRKKTTAKRKVRTARNGVLKEASRPYLENLGWKWTPTMLIGQGCKVHLNPKELPAGRLIVSISRHLVAVIDGVVHDTYDCTRNGTRCVYGYYTK